MNQQVTKNERFTSRAGLMRAVNFDGVSIQVVNHWQPHLVGTVRVPLNVRNGGKKGIQTNGYWFRGLSHDGKECDLWAEIPAAKELQFNADGTVTFHPGQEKSWTLKFELAS